MRRIATWRASIPEGKRDGSHRALRQVLQAAVRWRWIEDNPAVHVKNREPRAGEIDPFNSWEELDAIAAELNAIYGPLVVLLAGTGVRPEEAFGAEWRDVDLRHTYATWSLAAGVDIFTLARRMGTSVKMIDRTYGHLVAGADAYERELLDAFDRAARTPRTLCGR